jgi:hypothetical protein
MTGTKSALPGLAISALIAIPTAVYGQTFERPLEACLTATPTADAYWNVLETADLQPLESDYDLETEARDFAIAMVPMYVPPFILYGTDEKPLEEAFNWAEQQSIVAAQLFRKLAPGQTEFVQYRMFSIPNTLQDVRVLAIHNSVPNVFARNDCYLVATGQPLPDAVAENLIAGLDERNTHPGGFDSGLTVRERGPYDADLRIISYFDAPLFSRASSDSGSDEPVTLAFYSWAVMGLDAASGAESDR